MKDTWGQVDLKLVELSEFVGILSTSCILVFFGLGSTPVALGLVEKERVSAPNTLHLSTLFHTHSSRAYGER